MDGRPILPSGCVGWWIYIVYNIFIPPRARELLLYLYMTTHFNITISFPRLAFFFFSSIFFFSSSAFYLFDMYCLPIHLFLFFIVFFLLWKKKSYFVSNREPSGLSPNPISQSRILKSPGAVMYSNKWTSGSWFDWKLVYRCMIRRLNVVFPFNITSIWFNGLIDSNRFYTLFYLKMNFNIRLFFMF